MKKILTKKQTLEVINILYSLYPDAKAELNYTSEFELLVATILSAQCTDVRVNKVTKELFKKYNTPKKMITLSYEELEKYIKSCGFFRVKAKSIIDASHIIIKEFEGKVPNNLKDLIKLPGVGRKVANVVLSNVFDTPAIAVDTHVFRVTNRIGIVDEKDVLKTEMALMKKIPKDLWTKSHHLFIFHGRRVCKARTPDCDNCQINSYCRYYKNERGV